jgi:type IV fimbrial biogenesis protein FimT
MKFQAGFTIIELMLVVAVGGVMLALALPSYSVLMKNNCRTTAANSLVTALQLARSEAVKRGRRVSVAAADTTLDGNEWGTGWTVFLDDDSDGVVDALEETLRLMELTCEQPAGGTNRMTILGKDAANNELNVFSYLPTGAIVTAGSFEICHAQETAERGRQITISNTGRPSMNSTFVCP